MMYKILNVNNAMDHVLFVLVQKKMIALRFKLNLNFYLLKILLVFY